MKSQSYISLCWTRHSFLRNQRESDGCYVARDMIPVQASVPGASVQISVDYCMLHLTRQVQKSSTAVAVWSPLSARTDRAQGVRSSKCVDFRMVLHMLYENIHDSGSCGIPDRQSPSSYVDVFAFQVPSRRKFFNRKAVCCCRSAAISLSRLHVGATYAGGLPTLPGTRFLPVAPEDGLADVWSWSLAVVRTVPSSTVAIVDLPDGQMLGDKVEGFAYAQKTMRWMQKFSMLCM